jgi:hypothetical protein
MILLTKRNKVTLVWVPGHRGIAANEKAVPLARKGPAKNLLGLNQYLESLKPQPVSPFLRGLNYKTRYIGPTWQVTEKTR